MKVRFYIPFLLLPLLISCSKSKISNFTEYMKWINNPEHGLVKEKYVSGLKISVKYLPPDFLAHKELKRMESRVETTKDSLVNLYSKSKTFLITIAPDEREGEKKGDLMLTGISNYREYKERVFDLNFNLEEYVELIAGKEVYEPVLSGMINGYDLTNKKEFYLVFSEKQGQQGLDQSKEMDLVFDDEFFNSGRTHFLFKQEHLASIPQFVF
ncbi:MAG: hypothetical protein J7604_25670 [Sporocytophaga sp.]|uniref:hypothetical protein n=1 Tax=Sporocytophaga sp. TaxID=2231183 RepID=UPI001B156DDB|nr:hypothetical protein [Sporocytophaga sp.]MBO9703619.1 hypothetical protein [Sporocytophaga sp.]